MRQDPVRHRLVVTHQIELGEACAWIDDTVAMTDFDAGRLGAAQRDIACNCLGRFAANGFYGLIVPQGDIRGMADLSVRGPVRELHLSYQSGFHPTLITRPALGPTTGLFATVKEGRAGSFHLRELDLERGRFLATPARPHTAHGQKPSALIVYAEQQAADLP